MAFVHGRTLSRCSKGEVLFGVIKQPMMMKEKGKEEEDATLYKKKKKGKYKKTEWTEEKIKTLASRLEAARREIREMKRLIEESERIEEEKNNKLLQMRRRADEMKIAFALK